MNPLEELTLLELRLRTSEKWRTYPSDVLPLWVAEMDTAIPGNVRERLERALREGDTGYSHGVDMIEACAEFASQRWGWDQMSPDNAVIVPDVMSGIVEAIKKTTSIGDAVVVTSPVYAPFYNYTRGLGRVIWESPLDASGRIDLENMRETVIAARKVHDRVSILLANPHNPTGTVHTLGELSVLAEIAREHDAVVISDEIHSPLVLKGAEFTPYLSVPNTQQDYSLVSASKGWNLAGFKAAILMGGASSCTDLIKIRSGHRHDASHIGVIAQTAAFQAGGEWLDTLLAGLESNREMLKSLVEKHMPGAILNWPQATYLAWIDCSRLKADLDEIKLIKLQSEPAKFFLERGKVAFSSGASFGKGGLGHMRVNFGCSQNTLELAFSRVRAALQN